MARYLVDPDRSRLWAEARSNVHPIRIEVTGVAGTIEVRAVDGTLELSQAPRARLEIPSDKVKSGIDLYDDEIARRMEVRKYARIRGEVVEVRPDGSRRYRVRGKLSLHGVTREIEGSVEIDMPDERTLEIRGEHEIDMRDFDLDPPKIMMLEVKPEIQLRGHIFAVKEA